MSFCDTPDQFESPADSSELLCAALGLAARGWHVIPLHTPTGKGCSCAQGGCGSIGKHPRIGNWPEEAATDPETITEWWTRWPEANIGIVTGSKSGLVVLDEDGPEGREFLRGKQLYPTPVATTGKGFHYYFAHPGGIVRNFSKRLPGLDLRGDGGYVVAPPSFHASGRRYEWDTHTSPDVIELAPAPEWLLEPLELQKPPSPADNDIPGGRRNSTLTSLAGTMRRKGMSEEAILAALQKENAARCIPPLPEDEVRRIAHGITRYAPAAATYHRTDLGNAERLIHLHGPDIKFCYPERRWYVWIGRRWEPDKTGELPRLARKTARAIYNEAANAPTPGRAKSLARHADKSEGKDRLKAMIDLAQAETPVLPEDFDQNPYLLNCLNGTLNLRSGSLASHKREDLITKLVPVEYNPDAVAPTWEGFLDRIMAGDQDLIQFLQRAIGYSLTGDTTEQCFFILYGQGSNGKSTFLETIRTLLGDYAQQANSSTFLVKRVDSGPSNDLAAMVGARFIAASEVSPGRLLDEALVKQVTGGESIRARFLYADFFEFHPQFKLFLGTNHKPRIRGADLAIWRRIRLIPFNVTIPTDEQDPKMLTKLQAELPGILNWALRGSREWMDHGLGKTEAVAKATHEYQTEMDLLGGFLEDCCEMDPAAWVTTSELKKAYNTWCDENGEKPVGNNAFADLLRARECSPDRKGHGSGRIWRGVKLT